MVKWRWRRWWWWRWRRRWWWRWRWRRRHLHHALLDGHVGEERREAGAREAVADSDERQRAPEEGASVGGAAAGRGPRPVRDSIHTLVVIDSARNPAAVAAIATTSVRSSPSAPTTIRTSAPCTRGGGGGGEAEVAAAVVVVAVVVEVAVVVVAAAAARHLDDDPREPHARQHVPHLRRAIPEGGGAVQRKHGLVRGERKPIEEVEGQQRVDALRRRATQRAGTSCAGRRRSVLRSPSRAPASRSPRPGSHRRPPRRTDRASRT